MAKHKFGGDWTEDKLRRLGQYLNAYRKIFAVNARAKYFTTWYVDAFAGTGSRSSREPSELEQNLFEEVYGDIETSHYRDGSPRIALGLASPFDYYLFIEKSKTRVEELKASISRSFPKLFSRCRFDVGDANESLKEWCGRRNWAKERAVVFLDPYGMQVEWGTIETLARTKGVDLWYLFPLGVGIARLLPHDGAINEGWEKRLTVVLGTNDWRSRFYQAEVEAGLFGDWEVTKRNASEKNIQSFIEERLATCFAKVAKGKVLRNSKSSPMYLLCFAASNERGASKALRIAQWVLDD